MTSDPLTIRPTVGLEGEFEHLLAFLDRQRAVIAWKVDGVGPDDGVRSIVPSGSSLFGVISHLTWVEAYWFREVFAGEAVQYPFDFEADPDADFSVEPGTTSGQLIEQYRAMCVHTNRLIREAESLDRISEGAANGKRVTLRWILLHLIEETARHAGHADLAREMIDGSTGYMP